MATKGTGFRIPDDVKAAAQAKAAARGETLAAVVDRALRRYTNTNPPRDRVTLALTPAQARALLNASGMWTPITTTEDRTLTRARARLLAAIRAAGAAPDPKDTP